APPTVWRVQKTFAPENKQASMVARRGAMSLHHVIAARAAQLVHQHAGDERLLRQDASPAPSIRLPRRVTAARNGRSHQKICEAAWRLWVYASPPPWRFHSAPRVACSATAEAALDTSGLSSIPSGRRC